MASISVSKNNHKTVQFVGADGKRRNIRLGKTSKKAAQAVAMRVEHLASAKAHGTPLDPGPTAWLAGVGDVLVDKLAAVSLVPPRIAGTLAGFLDAYIAGRNDIKVSTRDHMKRARNDLVAHFGGQKALRDITPGDADDFRQWLLGR